MKTFNSKWCIGIMSLLSLPPLCAADMSNKFSISLIKNTVSYDGCAGSDGVKPKSWKEVANAVLFYKKGSSYYEFTNFYPAPILIDNKIWPTSEHYYQAMKFEDNALQDQIRTAKTAGDAFDLGQEHKGLVRKDWEKVNLGIMAKAVYEKFKQNPPLANLLIMTDTKVLIEDAKGHDNFFGAGGNYKGKNYLGRILMLVRVMLGGKPGA